MFNPYQVPERLSSRQRRLREFIEKNARVAQHCIRTLRARIHIYRQRGMRVWSFAL